MARARRSSEMTEAERRKAAEERFSGPAFVNPETLPDEERERLEAMWAAFDAALYDNDYGPGIALGIFAVKIAGGGDERNSATRGCVSMADGARDDPRQGGSSGGPGIGPVATST